MAGWPDGEYSRVAGVAVAGWPDGRMAGWRVVGIGMVAGWPGWPGWPDGRGGRMAGWPAGRDLWLVGWRGVYNLLLGTCPHNASKLHFNSCYFNVTC